MSNALKEKEQKEVIESAKNAIKQILKMKGVILTHQKRLLSEMIWKITEADGLTAPVRTGYKKKLTYISESVKIRRSKGNNETADLIHEHVYMREGIVKKLLTKPINQVDEILKKAIACVVTKEEHTRLPHKIEECDGWDRYRNAKIKVFNTKTEPWKDLGW